MPRTAIKFRQHWCAHCGYSLRGLRVDRCPECGETFGDDQIVIFGWPRFLLDKPRPLHLGCLVTAILYFGVMAAVAALQRLWGDFVAQGSLFLLLAAWYPTLWILRVVILRKTLRPWSQVRLTPEGFGGRRGFGQVKLWDWTPGMEVTLIAIQKRIYCLRLIRVSEIGTMNWTTLTEIVFRASPARVAELRAYIETRRNSTRTT
jgi:hypothetical protein